MDGLMDGKWLDGWIDRYIGGLKTFCTDGQMDGQIVNSYVYQRVKE